MEQVRARVWVCVTSCARVCLYCTRACVYSFVFARARVFVYACAFVYMSLRVRLRVTLCACVSVAAGCALLHA